MIVVMIVVPLSVVHANSISKAVQKLYANQVTYERKFSATSASEVKLLSARTNPDTKSHQGGGDVIVDEGMLISGGPFHNDGSGDTLGSGEISIHTVRPCTPESCETLSHIAEMYGVSVNTILWANDIDDPKSVQPGDDLIILPITGVRHIVKEKETLVTIAKKYGAETSEQVDAMISDIIDYNRLASASDISVGETVVVPGGIMHTAKVNTPTKSGTPTKTQTAAGGNGFSHPLPGSVRTQGIHGYNAVDLAAAIGTPIRAAAAGEVIVSKSGGWNGGYGNYVVIKHSNGTQTLYAHTSSNAVSVGANVSAGETIAYVGNTGQSTGAHLHFEVRGTTNPF